MLAGAATYNLIKNRPAAILLALGSHFILDAIPHFELSLFTNYLLAILTGLIIFLRAWQKNDYIIFLAVFMAALPDINWIIGLSKEISKVHRYFHFKGFVGPYFFFIEAVLACIFTQIYLGKWSKSRRQE